MSDCTCSNPAVALDKRALMQDWEREQKRASAERLAVLRAELRAKKRSKRQRLAAVRAHCRDERRAVSERIKRMRADAKAAASAEAEAMRAASRSSCVVEADQVHVDVARAEAAVRAEEARQKESRALKRAERIWRKPNKGARRVSARERRDESDDEVRQNIPPEYLATFERVKRGIKGTARKSRTEAFLQWLEEHPGEVFADIDDATDAMIAAHERALRANPRELLLDLDMNDIARARELDNLKVSNFGVRGYGVSKDVRAAGETVRARRAAERAARPEGYGVEERAKGNRGQLRMFNPGRELVLLGRLTLLDYVDASGRVRVLRWAFTRAPLLAYDAGGRLHIVHGRRVTGRASQAARDEYARSHWGQRGEGDALEGSEALAPFERLGTSRTITYTTTKGADRELVDYVHEWGEGGRGRFVAPVVVRHKCGAKRCAGNGLVALAGGSYRVTERGIVG